MTRHTRGILKYNSYTGASITLVFATSKGVVTAAPNPPEEYNKRNYLVIKRLRYGDCKTQTECRKATKKANTYKN